MRGIKEKKEFKPRLIGLAVSQALVCAPIASLNAATINVDPPGTPGGCTLIEAINTANSDGPSITCVQGNGPDTINLPSNAVFSYTIGYAGLRQALPWITSTITINGNGSTIQRDPAAVENFGLILVRSNSANLSLNHAIVSGGKYSLGAGITVEDEAEVIITNTTISGNSGDGLHARDTDFLSVTGSTFSGNSFSGLEADDVKTLSLTNSKISGNESTGLTVFGSNLKTYITNSTITNNGGSGIFKALNSGLGILRILDSTFSANQLTGIRIKGPITTSINGSTISGNSATKGGGINLENISTTITNSTISGNSAEETGGGLFIHSISTLKLANNTIFSNKAAPAGLEPPYSGGGLYAETGATLDLDNTVIAKSSPTDCGGLAPGTGSGNWFEDSSCSGTGMGDPKLGALEFNGGPTKTHAPLPGSGLEGAGNIFGCLNPPVNNLDQRGETRNNPCFIGAVDDIIDPVVFFTIPLPNGKALVIAL